MNLSAVILAAGASSRMGRPKALLMFRGETILDRLIGIYSRAASPVIVVLGYHEEAIRAGLTRTAQARFVVNPDPQRGQLSSLQCGLLLAPADAMFTPVDFPAVEEDTVAALVREFREHLDAPLVAPAYRGKHGHPVFVRARVKEQLLALSATADTARQVLHSHSAEARYVDVDDPGVITDIDRQEDYERLLEREAARNG